MTGGSKYVIRTDVLYMLPPQQAQQQQGKQAATGTGDGRGAKQQRAR